MRLFTIFFLFLTANPLFLEAANESANCNTSTTSTLMIEAVADTVTVLINESVSFNVLENDIGDVYVNSAFNPVYGSISWSVNGNMTYTPDEDYTGPDVFVYQIKDSEDNVASTSVFVNVGGMASTDLLVETFVECAIPEMGQYMVNISIIGGKPPYEILVYYGDDLTDLFAEQFFLDQPVPFAYGPIFDDLKYAVAIKDSENTIVMDNQLLDYLCMSETGSTCVPETGLEMQLVSTCENGEQSDDVVATGGSGFYNFFYTPNDPFVPHTVVEDSEGCQNILFYHDIPPYTCPVANDDVVNGAYNAPFSLKPLLNDTGEGLYISDLKGLKHGMIQWRPDGILAYFPNDDFVGIDTLEYEITDFAGNTARATILAVVPENDEVQIFWERNCTRAVGEGVYEINFTVAGGKPPYVIDGDFLAAGYRGDEVLSFIKADGENFMLTAIDKDGESISIQEELISCTFLPPLASDFSVYISCVEGDDYGILTALDPNDEFLQNSFEGNNHGDTIPNEETYLVNFHDYDVSFEGTVYCPAIAVDDLYYGHPNFLDLPLTFNPLLNDNGHGLKLVNVESPNHGSVEWWEASGTMNYRSNADFQGVETFDYTVEDIGGNRTSATITIILANPINLAITYERDCFEVNNNGAENYEVKAFVSGGKPPYQVQVNEGEAFEVAANGDSFVFEVANEEGFQIYATDDGAVTHEATVDELEIEACSPFFVQVERDCTHFCETGTYDLGVFVTGGTPPYHIFGSINETLESQGVTTAPIENGSTYEIYVTDSEGNEFHKTGGELPCSNFGGCCHVYEIESIDEIAECLCDGSMVFTFDVDSIVYVFGEWYNDTEYDLVQIGDTIPADAYLNLFSAYTEYPSTHDDCYYFVFQDEGDFSGLVSDFCNYSTDIEAVNDKIEIDTLEPFTIDVLANDKGACLKLKDIVIYPCCGWLNAIEEGGTITYSPNNNSKNCIEDSFVYLIEDVDGNVELAEVLISLPPSDLVVTVERDCNNAESTGIYTLNVLIANGTPPFTISGSINEVLNQTGLTSTLITDGNPYEISVVDSEGNKFFEVGAEIGCLSLCGVIEVENINIIGQCTCNGEIILDYNGFFDSDETVESIDGVWFDGINEVEVGLGDTIPANAVVEISGMWTNENCYSFQSRCQRGLSVFVSSYCTPENYTFEVVDDFASVGPGEDVIINALQNDTGTGLQITQIISPPSCGQIMDANVETGIIIYVADADTECNVDTFVVEIEDDCGNLAEATVTIFIEPGENEFFIEVEKNCFHVAETGTYELTVSILSGTPPFTISGSINEVLEEVGIASVTIGDGNPYEVSVVDATGAEFFEAGGEVSCGHCESNPLALDSIEQIIDCTCSGDMIVHFEDISISGEIISIDGLFSSSELEKIIEIGDTIPHDAIFDMYTVFTEDYCYGIYLNGSPFTSGNVSNFCNPENYTFEAIDDFASVERGEDVLINIFQNDTGTGLQITQILSPPNCGQIMDINVETGTIVYLADVDTECSIDTFVVEVEDDCGNLTETTVSVFTEHESELIVQVERDCSEVGLTGFYTLNISFFNGTFPLVTTGTIDTTLFEYTPISVQIEDGIPYEVLVTDGEGSQFYETGGEVSCCQLGFLDFALNESESQTFLCGEGDIILSLEGGGEGTTYNWYLDPVGTTPANPPTGQVWVSDEIIGPRILYVIAMNINGCESEPLAIPAYHYIPLLIDDLDIEVDELDCEGYRVSFNITGGNGVYTVNGDSNPESFTSEWLSFEEDYSFTIDDSPLIPNCEPVIISGLVDETDCCIGETLEITPSFECLITETQDSIAVLSYQATGGNGNYTFNGNPQNDTLQNGDIYQIEVTDGNGCTASISDTIACNIVSVENPNPYSPNIQLFPNPNKGNFTLVLPLQQTETVNIEIFNAFGQVKIRRRLKNTATFEQHDFNLDLNSGLYFVRVSGENWIWTEKMVVE